MNVVVGVVTSSVNLLTVNVIGVVETVVVKTSRGSTMVVYNVDIVCVYSTCPSVRVSMIVVSTVRVSYAVLRTCSSVVL